MPETTVNSFVVRFVQELPAQSGAESKPWHGTIRHVQSSQQSRFTHIEDALAFMNGYVDVTSEISRNNGGVGE